MTTYTNAQWLTQLAADIAALQAGTMTQAQFVTAMQSYTDGWVGSQAATSATGAATAVQSLVQQVTLRDANFDAWVVGTLTGGYTDATGATHGGPWYPLTSLAGGAVYLMCPAGLAQITQKGDPGGVAFQFSTATADADPGAGKVAFDNATVASVGHIYANDHSLAGTDLTSYIAGFGDSTTVSPKGTLLVQDVASGGVLVFSVTAAPTAATGYQKIPVTYLAGGLPANNDRLVLFFVRAGNRGGSFLYGSGAPASGTGIDGDVYINISTGDFYGPKASGAWGSPTSSGLTGYVNAAASSATAAAASATTAQNYATKTNGYAAGADNSAASWAIGGTGSGQPAAGPAKDWAQKTGATVDGSEYAAKEYAIGTTAPAGSAKSWAQETGASVDGSGYSAKEWSVGITLRGVAGGGSAKDWANYTGGPVDGAEFSAKKYATDAATSAALVNAQTLGRESGYVWAVVDAAGREAIGILPDGTFKPLKVSYPAGSIGSAALDQVNIAPFLPVALNAAETGFVFALMGAASRYALAVQADGTVLIPKFSLANNSVTSAKLDQVNIAPFIPVALNSAETGFCFALIDAAGRYAAAVKTDGTLVAPKLSIANGTVTFAQLATALQGLIPQSMSSESGYVFAVVDALNRIGFGIAPDGSITLKLASASIPNGGVTEAKLSADIDRLVVPHIGDVVEVMPDNWRGKYSSQGGPAVDTAADGTFWVQFPSFLTRNLRGINTSGTSLQFRKTAGLHFRGKRMGAGWNPIAVVSVSSTHYVADTTNPSALSTAGRSAGDYYRYSALTTTTFNSQTVGLGDLIVFDGSAYQVQKAPTPISSSDPTTRAPGDWWSVTTAGTFDGVTYAVGDRIVYLGYDSKSGQGNALWYKGQASSNGELFYNGEFSASGGSMPSSPSQGDVWQASTAGTIGSLTFAVGDYAIYDQGVWGAVANATSVTVANAAMIPALPCVQSAYEWEVRRSDKSATVVGVQLGARHQTAPRRAIDGVICRSDSMFGVPNVGPQLATLVSPRSVTAITRGGGTSRNVLSTYENEIVNGGDPYRAYFQFLWQGQNNQPSAVGDANWAQIVEVALKFAELFGSRDKRFCFLSILGQNNMSFNGTRIAASQHENMFAGTGALWALEQWYAANFPGQWLSPRQTLLTAAAGSAIQDVRVPAASVGGAQMTEAQTAATYGWVPYSYFSGPQTWPFTLSSLNLVGYWSSAGLPAGGSPNDAYTRSGGGAIGNLIVNVAGTWTEYAPDITHLGPGANQGGQYLAAGMAAFLSTNIL